MSKRGARVRRVEKCGECGRRMRRVVLDSYQYVDGGLSNIYLHRVAAYTCRCGEELLELPKIDTLHSLIVQKLLTKPSQLKGAEVRFLRKYFELKAIDLAKMLGVDPVTVSRWETDTAQIGPANDKLIRFSVVAKASERAKNQANEIHRQITDAYLDLFSEINALRTKETNDEAVSITSEEIEHPRLVFKTIRLPDVQDIRLPDVQVALA